MRRYLTTSLAVAAALVLSCAGPLTVDGLADTRVKELCHFAYSCCTPVERDKFLFFAFADESGCVAEAKEDESFGTLYTLDAVAKDAIARGTGTYDADAADRCAAAVVDDIDQCDAKKLFTRSGAVDFNKLILLVDPGDLECLQLAQRDFVRGGVGGGGDCASDLDCKEFGTCVPVDDTVTTRGTCKIPVQEGDDCRASSECALGLSCVDATCQKIEPKADGEACTVDTDCASDKCELVIEDGACFLTGEPCTSQDQCGVDDFCEGNFVQQCAASVTITAEICDGTE